MPDNRYGHAALFCAFACTAGCHSLQAPKVLLEPDSACTRHLSEAWHYLDKIEETLGAIWWQFFPLSIGNGDYARVMEVAARARADLASMTSELEDAGRAARGADLLAWEAELFRDMSVGLLRLTCIAAVEVGAIEPGDQPQWTAVDQDAVAALREAGHRAVARMAEPLDVGPKVETLVELHEAVAEKYTSGPDEGAEPLIEAVVAWLAARHAEVLWRMHTRAASSARLEGAVHDRAERILGGLHRLIDCLRRAGD